MGGKTGTYTRFDDRTTLHMGEVLTISWGCKLKTMRKIKQPNPLVWFGWKTFSQTILTLWEWFSHKIKDPTWHFRTPKIVITIPGMYDHLDQSQKDQYFFVAKFNLLKKKPPHKDWWFPSGIIVWNWREKDSHSKGSQSLIASFCESSSSP